MGKVKLEPPSNLNFDYKTAIYADKCMAINEVIKRDLTEPLQPVSFSKIKLTRLKAIIRSLKVADADIEPVRKAYLANLEAVKAFIVAHGNYYLNGTKTYEQAYAEQEKNQKPVWDTEGNFKHLEPFFEPYEIKHVYTDDEIKKQQETYERIKDELGEYATPPAKKGEFTIIRGVRIKDLEGLKEAIKKTVREKTTYVIREPNFDGDAYRYGLDPVFLEISKLNAKLGIEPSGGLWARQETNTETNARRVAYMYGTDYTEPNKDPKIITTDLRMSDRIGYVVILWSLVKAKGNADNETRRPTTAVNIRKDFKGDIIPKPPIDMTIADMEQLSDNPKSVETLNKVYRNSQALDAEGGLLATTNDPTLFDMLPAQYQEPTKLLGLMNRATRRGMVALARYLHNNPEPPSELDTTEIAKSYGAYDEQIKKHGRLPTHYLNELITELILIKGTSTTYTYYDNDLKKEMIGSIKFYDFDISTDGRTIKNLRLSQEYTDRLNDQKHAMLHLALPKSIDYLKPFAQDIAFKILQRFVGVRGEKQQKQRMSKTINGEVLKVELADLYKGYINARNKSERQRAKRKTLEALDEIKDKGDIVADYEVVEEKGYKYYVVLVPSEFIRNAYKDKTLNEIIESQYKDEQKRRRADLKRLVEFYRKDFKDKKDATEYLDALADDLGLKDRTELGYYLLEPNKRKKITPKEIDDELYKIVRELLTYYDDEK